jgi:hypothetical protein
MWYDVKIGGLPMTKEQKLKALQAVLVKGEEYTISEIKDAIKTITGASYDNMENNALVSLYNGGVMLAPCSDNPNESIAIEFYTTPVHPGDSKSFEKTKVQIRHIDFK